jgi:hypothetical protein
MPAPGAAGAEAPRSTFGGGSFGFWPPGSPAAGGASFCAAGCESTEGGAIGGAIEGAAGGIATEFLSEEHFVQPVTTSDEATTMKSELSFWRDMTLPLLAARERGFHG